MAGQSTSAYGGATANYQPYTAERSVVYGGQTPTQGYSVPTNYSTVQMGNPTNATYNAVQDITRPAPVTKITFGGKQFTETIKPQQYESTYVPPTTSYQTYPTYAQPTEIQTITSQPIREEVRVEQVVQLKQVEREEVLTTPVPAPVSVETRRKQKKGGCPQWLWYLLGALLLLGLIVGLIFLFKGLNAGKSSGPVIVSNGTSTTAETNTTATADVTPVTTTPTATTTTTTTTTNATSGTTYVTPTVDTTTPTATITTPVTVPTATVDTTTVTPTYDDSIAPTIDYGTPTAATTAPVTDYSYGAPVAASNYPTTNDYYASPAASYAAPSTNDYYASPSASYASPTADYSQPSFDVTPTSVY